MFFTERFSTNNFIPRWVIWEHQARYEFAKKFVAGREVVDCAAGDGTGSYIFTKEGARRVLAFDISEKAIENNRKKYQLDNLVFQTAEAVKLPVPEKSADIFISLETIEHLAGDLAFLAEVKRVLRENGVFICSTPNRRVTNPGRNISAKPWNKFHVREYDFMEFKNLLSLFFEEIKFYGQNPVWPKMVKWKIKLARVFSWRPVVFFSQIAKLPRLWFDRPEKRAVTEMSADREYEYMVAVCRRPRA